jgi:hypothetical protein
MTPLDKSLKRALKVKGRDYVVALTPDLLKITEKGRRIGVELKWEDLISGESALAVALHASLGVFAGDSRSARDKGTSHTRPAANKKLVSVSRRPRSNRPMSKRSR